VVQQPIVVRLDGSIAFAGFPLEALQVNNLDVPPGIADETGLLEHVRHRRNAAPSPSDHLGKKFLGEVQRAAPGQIACPQKTKMR
jgi:hypothetical protein